MKKMLSAPRKLALAVPFFLLWAGGLVASPQESDAAPSGANLDRAKAYYHYSIAHLNMMRFAEHGRQEYVRGALENYEQAIEADPESSFLRLELVKFYGRTNRLDEAIAEADRILEKDPDNTEVRKVIGSFQRSYAQSRRGSFDKEKLQQAVEQFEQVIEIDAADEEALLQLSSLYRILEDNEKAEESLRKLLEIKPDSTEALSNLAQLHLSMGQYGPAIEALEKVKNSGEADPRSLASLGGAYENVGRHREAADPTDRVHGGPDVPGDRQAARGSQAHPDDRQPVTG